MAAAAAAGTGAGRTLAAVGINVNLAPVLDVYSTAGNFIDQYQRSYSANPGTVAALGRAFITAQQRTGVAATAKHFPGLGRAATEQNTSAPTPPALAVDVGQPLPSALRYPGGYLTAPCPPRPGCRPERTNFALLLPRITADRQSPTVTRFHRVGAVQCGHEGKTGLAPTPTQSRASATLTSQTKAESDWTQLPSGDFSSIHRESTSGPGAL
jgi:hypothetical protein